MVLSYSGILILSFTLLYLTDESRFTSHETHDSRLTIHAKIQDEFEQYWQDQQVLALAKLCEEEQLDKEQFNALIEAYIFSGQEPIRDDVFKCLGNRPSIFAAREVGNRIIQKMKEFVEVFVEGMAA